MIIIVIENIINKIIQYFTVLILIYVINLVLFRIMYVIKYIVINSKYYIMTDLSNLLRKIDKDIIIKNKIGQGSASNTYHCKYEGEENILKHADDTVKYHNLRIEYEACNHISKYSSINIPESVKYVENSQKNSLAIFSKVNTRVPCKDDWENKLYCSDIVESGINVLNELHCNEHLQSGMRETECAGNIIHIEDILTNKYEIIKNSGVVDDGQVERISDIIDYISENHNYKPIFSHYDFTIINYGFNDGILPLYDWQTCGYSDCLWDIAAFENAIIDEFIYYFHSEQFVNKIRDKFRNNTCKNTKKDVYILYKYIQLLTTVCVVGNGDCSSLWLKVGSEKDIIEQKSKQLSEIEEDVKSII